MASGDDVLSPGAGFGGYAIERLRSVGGFASVYRARQRSSGRQVALKILHPFLAADRRMIVRFQQEAELVAQLRHPSIVELIEHGAIDGRAFLAMEWLEGRDLEEEIAARGPLSLPEAVALMESLCSALSAAHAM